MRERTGLRAERAALVALVADGIPDADRRAAAEYADPEKLMVLSARHRVVSIVRARLRELELVVRPDLQRAMDHACIVSAAVKMQAEHTAATLTSVLDVPFLLLKGPVLAAAYDDPTLRDYTDLDVLVRPGDFDHALANLEHRGGSTLLTNWHGWLAGQVGEVPVSFGGTTIDLHWSLIALGRTRKQLNVPEPQMFERAVPASVGTNEVAEVRTLDAEDTLLHLCVNTGLEGGRRLRNLLDIDVFIRTGRVDFERFSVRTRRSGTGRLAASVLTRCRDLLHTPVDPDAVRDLTPGGSWLLLQRLFDRLPLVDPASSIAPGLLVGSGRGTAAASATALMGNLGSAVGERLGAPGPTRPGGRLDWNRVPADGDAARHRRAYLDWLAGEPVTPSHRR